MSKTKEDLFGLNNDSEDENVSADEEEQEDSRFSKFRLQKQDLSEDNSDDSDDDDHVKKESTTTEGSSENDDSEEEDETNGKEKVIKEEKSTQQLEKKDETDVDEGESEDELGVEGYDAPKDMTAFGFGKNKIRPDKKIKALTPEELEKFEQARKNTGVCYLSRIPPFMPPSRVRSLLSRHAEIGRIFLVPEDSKSTAKRKKYKKERRTNFIEGWVEFKDKKKAKSLAEHLNMREIGGKRKNEYYHEMWNIKYLPKFKWHHLTEHRGKKKESYFIFIYTNFI
jgi:ESF2/ABP1 family protein